MCSNLRDIINVYVDLVDKIGTEVLVLRYLVIVDEIWRLRNELLHARTINPNLEGSILKAKLKIARTEVTLGLSYSLCMLGQ